MTTIQCTACNSGESPQFATNIELNNHLPLAHGGATSMIAAMKYEKSVRASTPADVPSTNQIIGGTEQSFAESLQNAQRAKDLPVPPVLPIIKQPQVSLQKPIKLKYSWEGTCEKCISPVRTIMTEANGLLFSSAYCLSCDETLRQLEVTPIKEDKKK